MRRGAAGDHPLNRYSLVKYTIHRVRLVSDMQGKYKAGRNSDS